MNCLEWLPIYFGILKSGAMAVPLNFRYTPQEIKYCLELADVDILIFGPEFVGRMECICESLPRVKAMLYVGDDCPSFAEPYYNLVSYCSSKSPSIPISRVSRKFATRLALRSNSPHVISLRKASILLGSIREYSRQVV